MSPPHVVQPLPLQAITSKVYSIANGKEETCTIEGVTPILFEELHSWGQENLPAWEGLQCEHLYTTCLHSFLTNLDKYKIDLHNDILVVGWPLSFGQSLSLIYWMNFTPTGTHSQGVFMEGKRSS
jgi:hypothetical protein